MTSQNDFALRPAGRADAAIGRPAPHERLSALRWIVSTE